MTPQEATALTRDYDSLTDQAYAAEDDNNIPLAVQLHHAAQDIFDKVFNSGYSMSEIMQQLDRGYEHSCALPHAKEEEQ